MWNEHTEISINKGQKILMRNLRTSVFREQTSLNSADETSISVCVSAIVYLQSVIILRLSVTK